MKTPHINDFKQYRHLFSSTSFSRERPKNWALTASVNYMEEVSLWRCWRTLWILTMNFSNRNKEMGKRSQRLAKQVCCCPAEKWRPSPSMICGTGTVVNCTWRVRFVSVLCSDAPCQRGCFLAKLPLYLQDCGMVSSANSRRLQRERRCS